jgi:hypothetical protein
VQPGFEVVGNAGAIKTGKKAPDLTVLSKGAGAVGTL